MNTSLNQGNQLNQERNTLIQNNNIEQQNLNNVSKINNEESSNRIDFMNDIYDLKNSAKNIHESGLEKQEKLTNTLNTRLNQIHTDLYVSSDDLVALDSNLNQISNKDKILTTSNILQSFSKFFFTYIFIIKYKISYIQITNIAFIFSLIILIIIRISTFNITDFNFKPYPFGIT